MIQPCQLPEMGQDGDSCRAQPHPTHLTRAAKAGASSPRARDHRSPSLLLISGISQAHARLCWPTLLLSWLCTERALALFACAARPWGLGPPLSPWPKPQAAPH